MTSSIEAVSHPSSTDTSLYQWPMLLRYTYPNMTLMHPQSPLRHYSGPRSKLRCKYFILPVRDCEFIACLVAALCSVNIDWQVVVIETHTRRKDCDTALAFGIYRTFFGCLSTFLCNSRNRNLLALFLWLVIWLVVICIFGILLWNCASVTLG